MLESYNSKLDNFRLFSFHFSYEQLRNLIENFENWYYSALDLQDFPLIHFI